jgi:hypothetical protein
MGTGVVSSSSRGILLALTGIVVPGVLVLLPERADLTGTPTEGPVRSDATPEDDAQGR